MSDFQTWLAQKLEQLSVDPDVFSEYICGILSSSETDEEKSEALIGILSEACDDPDIITETSREIILHVGESTLKPPVATATSVIDDKFKTIFELQTHKVAQDVKDRQISGSCDIKDRILSQYAQVAVEVEDNDVEENVVLANKVSKQLNKNQLQQQHAKTPLDPLLMKNTNTEAVLAAEKAKREKAKLESEQKRQQDKLNRDKQKQDAVDRKEKEKKRTQKGERRR